MTIRVVGGGISGLAAALECLDRGAPVEVLEASERVGGMLDTEQSDELLLERGPDSLVRTKPEAIELCDRLHVDLIGTRPTKRPRALIVRDGRLLPIPTGFQLLAPTRLGPFLGSSLLSWPGKVRMSREWFLPCRDGAGEEDDESLASFVRRRFGQEALDRIAQPLIAGIYSGDPEQLSLRATMPRLLDLEREHGSVIRGMRSTSTEAAAGARYGLFQTPGSGMQTLVTALAEAIELEGGRISTGTQVESLSDLPASQAVILATPLPVTARLVEEQDADLAALLRGIPTTSTATINFVCPAGVLDSIPEGYGFVVPAVEKRFVMACSFSSRKYEDRSDEDQEILRAFVGGALGPDIESLSDEEIVQQAQEDLEGLLGQELGPTTVVLSRYHGAQPQYHLGHLDRVGAIEERVSRLPGLELAGNYLRGVGISDCIRVARRAADNCLSSPH
ncbi:MAG: protoporphyrinogen oxidase [Myxococcota bacterium]|nr:protoporphyrinogen oxidase [Myxococcota bacterium]